VKRYKEAWCYRSTWEMVESDDGPWVEYEDAMSELAALRAVMEAGEAFADWTNGHRLADDTIINTSDQWTALVAAIAKAREVSG
jgi:hypothetical protein